MARPPAVLPGYAYSERVSVAVGGCLNFGRPKSFISVLSPSEMHQLGLIITLSAFSCAAAQVKPKRGVVADGCTGASCPDGALLSNLGWYYDYNSADPWYGSKVSDESMKFVPMHWCIKWV